MLTKEADELLPDKPTKAISDPLRLKYLCAGPPKWGKTSFACDAPNSILLATEEGHAFHETTKLIIDCWHYPDFATKQERCWGEDTDGNTHVDMVTACEAIAASSKYQFVIIDTADMAAKMCLDYHLDKLKVSHASDAGDYGKGWDIALTQPFRKAISQIMKSGRGICFITHTKFVDRKVKGIQIARWETTLPSQVQHFLHTQADVVLHAEFGHKRKGQLERDRVFVLDGSNEILAGSRVRGVHLPYRYIVNPEHPWRQFANFFEDNKAVEKAEKDYKTLVLGGREADDEPESPPSQPISTEKSKKESAAKSRSSK